MIEKCSCIICKKELSIKGIKQHHNAIHNLEIRKRIIAGSKKGGAVTKANKDFELLYYKSPKLCVICNTIIKYQNKNNQCCSKQCRSKLTSLSNLSRVRSKWSAEQKQKNKSTKKTLTEQKQIVKLATKSITEPFCKVVYCSCHHCQTKFTNYSQKKYCSTCEDNYSHDGRAKYWFTFNVFDYPNLFDLSLIKTIGFRDSKTNPNGITRDHRVSVNVAIKNDYNPYYIKHPLNCELMSFKENNKKKSQCSISYEELVELVDNYDKNGGSARICAETLSCYEHGVLLLNYRP